MRRHMTALARAGRLHGFSDRHEAASFREIPFNDGLGGSVNCNDEVEEAARRDYFGDPLADQGAVQCRRRDCAATPRSRRFRTGSATHETRHGMAVLATSNLLRALSGDRPAATVE